MNQSSAALPRGEDEFEFSGVNMQASQWVKAARVAESPVNFECKLTQCIQLQDQYGQPFDSWLILGEVIGIHIAENLLNDQGVYQTAAANPILRAGGPSAYYTISDENRFDMLRPIIK